MKKLLLQSMILAAFGSSAFAADLPSKKEPPAFAPAAVASVYDWTGPYAGAQLGYGFGRDNIADAFKPTGFSDYSGKFGFNGVQGGLFAGYNIQSGALVYGVEADGVFAGAHGSTLPPFGYRVKTSMNSEAALRGRVGYAFDRALVYVAGGVAVANFKTSHIAVAATDSYTQTRAGWTLGTGVEYAFTNNWIGRVEYRYSNFGKFTNSDVVVDSNWVWHNRVSESAVRAAIAYKF